MKRTYQKLAISTIEPGEELNFDYCPSLAEDPLSKAYREHGFQVVGKATVTVEYFDKDEIHRGQMDVLKEQLQATRAENQKRENAILDQISKLQALTFVEAA